MLQWNKIQKVHVRAFRLHIIPITSGTCHLALSVLASKMINEGVIVTPRRAAATCSLSPGCTATRKLPTVPMAEPSGRSSCPHGGPPGRTFLQRTSSCLSSCLRSCNATWVVYSRDRLGGRESGFIRSLMSPTPLPQLRCADAVCGPQTKSLRPGEKR